MVRPRKMKRNLAPISSSSGESDAENIPVSVNVENLHVGTTELTGIPGTSGGLTGAISTQDSSAPNNTSVDSMSKLADAIALLTKHLGNNESTSNRSTILIPAYDPENNDLDIKAWAQKVDQIREISKWSDEVTAFNATRRLTGLAEKWLRTQSATVCSKWSELKYALIRSFPTKINYCELLQEMLNRRQSFNESLLQYYFDKVNLVQRCQITNENAVSCIIGGLSDSTLRRAAESGNFSNIEDLLGFLKNCHRDERRFWPTPSGKQGHHSVWKKRKIIKSSDADRHKRDPNTTIHCFYCRKEGHKVTACPSKTIDVCGFCRKRGHKEERCFRKAQLGQNNSKSVL